MELLSPVLGKSGDSLWFMCSGCGELHQIKIGVGPGMRWGWDGNSERPTFWPSIRMNTDQHLCHAYVSGGNLLYLSECTHNMAGQTVPLPPISDCITTPDGI